MQWAQDYWFAEDKWNHLTGSFFGTWFFYMVNAFVFQVKPFVAAWIYAALFTFLIGLGVEIIQAITKEDNVSWRDIVVNVIGIVLAVITIRWG